MEASADDVVAWSIAPTDTRVGRLCTYALAGWVGGLFLLPVGFLAVAVLTSTFTGNYGALALLALLVLVGGPFSVVALASFLDPDQRPGDDLGTFARVDTEELHPLALAVGVLLGAVGVATTYYVGVLGLLVVLLGVVPGAFFALAVVAPDAAVDLNARTLTLRGVEQDLDDLLDYRTHRLGDLVLVRPSFVDRPDGLGGLLYVAMPERVHDRVRPAFEAGVAADHPSANRASRGERVALAVAGLCTLALAGWFASIGATSATENSEILYWVASMPGVFGLFMLSLAVSRRS